MFFPAKQRVCPSAHQDLCLATIPPGGRSGGWGRSIWEERIPSGCSWRSWPPTSSCCSEKPSTRGAAATRSASARSPRPRRPTGHQARIVLRDTVWVDETYVKYSNRDVRHHLPHLRCPNALHAEGSLAQASAETPKELPPLFSPSHYGASRQALYSKPFALA